MYECLYVQVYLCIYHSYIIGFTNDLRDVNVHSFFCSFYIFIYGVSKFYLIYYSYIFEYKAG